MLRCSLASNPSHLQYWRTSKCPCHRACIYKACIWTKRGERCLLKTQCKQRSINYPSCESQWTSHQHLTTRLEETKTNSRKTNKVRGTCHDGSNTERIPISFRNDRRNPRNFPGHELLWIPDLREVTFCSTDFNYNIMHGGSTYVYSVCTLLVSIRFFQH